MRKSAKHQVGIGALSLMLSLFWVRSAAQDIHFSQYFNLAPSLGPGHIGSFDGDKRMNAVYRQQWRSVTVPYRTFGIGGDLHDAFGVHGLGLGAWVVNDRAGDSRLNQFQLLLGGSWTHHFGTENEHALTGGIQAGFTSLTLDNGGLSFDSQYNGFYYDPNLDDRENFARSGLVHPDVHVGAVYGYSPAARTNIRIGLGVFNLTSPGVGFLGGPKVALDRRSDLHILGAFPLNAKFDLLPTIRRAAQGTFREFIIGSNARYILLDRFGLKRTVLFGLHARTHDAGFLFLGTEYDDWTFGISYDINTSDLVPASRNRGAIEFTLVRIWKKRPFLPVRFKACPDQL